MQPEALSELLEGKFVDALRSVAAEMTMEEMHEKRGEYIRRVRSAVAEDLLQNGLELESVSLTNLDQTNMEFFNPSNAFDAEGLTRLTEQIERRKKIRNDIEQDTMIQIRNKNLETEKLSLDIDLDAESARLSQERQIEIARAGQRAELARERAEKQQLAERAEIGAASRSSAPAWRPTACSKPSASARSARSSPPRSSGVGRWRPPSSCARSPSPSSPRPSPKPRRRPTRPARSRWRRRRRCSPSGRPRWRAGARRSS